MRLGVLNRDDGVVVAFADEGVAFEGDLTRTSRPLGRRVLPSLPTSMKTKGKVGANDQKVIIRADWQNCAAAGELLYVLDRAELVIRYLIFVFKHDGSPDFHQWGGRGATLLCTSFVGTGEKLRKVVFEPELNPIVVGVKTVPEVLPAAP